MPISPNQIDLDWIDKMVYMLSALLHASWTLFHITIPSQKGQQKRIVLKFKPAVVEPLHVGTLGAPSWGVVEHMRAYVDLNLVLAASEALPADPPSCHP